jgi:hypothetical protein
MLEDLLVQPVKTKVTKLLDQAELAYLSEAVPIAIQAVICIVSTS